MRKTISNYESLTLSTVYTEYLTSWIKVLKNDNKAIFRAASKAREAAEFINELALEKQQENSKGMEM